MTKNLFIVLDGLDGSGKGEMIKRLENYLSSKKFNVLVTFEPTDGRYGKRIKEMLRKDDNPLKHAVSLLNLYVNDRKDHLEKAIEPFLGKKGRNIVICDRYYYSTMAYQHAQGLDMANIVNKNKCFRAPDLALILDLPVETALKRIGERGKPEEKFEKRVFMEKLRINFLNLRGYITDNIKIIDASKSKKDVFAQIKKKIDKII